jgi:hypothetical protein
MNGQKFLELLAEQIVVELQPNKAISKFTTNPDIIGAYAEASLRQMVSRIVHPLRVSTGAVISEQLCSIPNKVPQIDTIIWIPSPAPAIFCAGEFGLVPRGSCMGIMEIKRSAYPKVGRKLEEALDEKRVLSLVADQLFKTDNPDFPAYPALGVVCIREKGKSDRHLDNLIKKGHAIILFELSGEDLTPCPKDIHRLLNFLIFTRKRAKLWDGEALANVPLLRSQSKQNVSDKTGEREVSPP